MARCIKPRSTICFGCEQTARDTAKRGNRWIVKARDTVRRHAAKYITKGLVKTVDEFVDRFGWEPARVAHRLEHDYTNGCGYCDRPFKEMGNGLSDISVDIIDPTREPYFETNTRNCCLTCNREKHSTPPDQWAAKKRGWRLWEKHQEQLKTDPFFGTLFARKHQS